MKKNARKKNGIDKIITSVASMEMTRKAKSTVRSLALAIVLGSKLRVGSDRIG